MKLRIYDHGDGRFSIEEDYGKDTICPSKVIDADPSLVDRWVEAADEYDFMNNLLERLYHEG